MPIGKPNPQTIASQKYAEKVGYVSKSYRLKKDTVEAFAKACEAAGVSQAGQLTTWMKQFIDYWRIKSMTEQQISYVRGCMENRNMHMFYTWKPWLHTRSKVLTMDKGECQHCKVKGKYTKATTVHHINYVKLHPELALEIWYNWHGTKRRNLISLCHSCHEEVHGYRKQDKKLVTEEQW